MPNEYQIAMKNETVITECHKQMKPNRAYFFSHNIYKTTTMDKRDFVISYGLKIAVLTHWPLGDVNVIF